MRHAVKSIPTTAIASVALAVVGSATAAAQAPRQLYNKAVAFSYTTQNLVRDPDGKTHNSQTGISYTFYISSAGRIFERSPRSPAGGARQSGQLAPDAPA